MFLRVLKLVVPMACIVAMSACGNNPVYGKNGNFRLKDAGPDEFSVLPTKELELPEDLKALPEPTLGSKNRADLTPQSDAVVALGGKSDQLESTKIGSGEQALITAASRNGVSAGIREELAADDQAFRGKRKRDFMRRWIGSNGSYLRRHKDQSLNGYAELWRLQDLGVRTPTAPPR
jgi:hypothetical protein